jgi:hypothetical protein
VFGEFLGGLGRQKALPAGVLAAAAEVLQSQQAVYNLEVQNSFYFFGYSFVYNRRHSKW